MPTTYLEAPTQRVMSGNGIEYAYRDLGESDIPRVLLIHFRGNLDNWDPALIGALAANRRVITFDNVGVGATTGTTPPTDREHGTRRDRLCRGTQPRVRRSPRLLDRQFRCAGVRPDSPRRNSTRRACSIRAAGCRRYAWVGRGCHRVCRSTGNGSAGVSRCLLCVERRESTRGPTGHGTHFRTNSQSRRADDMADPPSAIRRGLRVGSPKPRVAGTPTGD